MTGGELLGIILDRLGHAKGTEELFGADEVKEWPGGMMDKLITARLFTRAAPVRSIDCDGCEQNCFMPVEILTAVDRRPARAFIACDKPVNIGRVPVNMKRLEQWKITGASLAGMLSNLLDFPKAPQSEVTSGYRWTLGRLKAEKHQGELKLGIENGVTFMVSGHTLPVAEFLTLDGKGLKVNRNELLRLVDHPAIPSGGSAYKPSIVRREARKVKTQERDQALRKKAKEYRRKPQGRKSDRWVSEQLARLPVAGGLKAETIRKRIR